MSGRTPRDAVEAYRERLQSSLSCITEAILLVSGGYYVADTPHALTISEDPSAVGRDLAISVAQRYEIKETDDSDRGPWKVSTVAYQYMVLNQDGQELFAYQWDRAGLSPVKFPHLHIGPGAGTLRSEFHKAHLPTGRVSFEEIAYLLISDFGIPPKREDWGQVLEANFSAFNRWRTW